MTRAACRSSPVEVSLGHLDGAGCFCEIEALTPDADIDAMAYDLRPRQIEPRT